MDTTLFGSICLTDIPKELITEGRNGKKYLSVIVGERREPSRFGNTHYLKAYARPEQRIDGRNYYIGDLKASVYSSNPSAVPDGDTARQPRRQTATAQDALAAMGQPKRQDAAAPQTDDLPF